MRLGRAISESPTEFTGRVAVGASSRPTSTRIGLFKLATIVGLLAACSATPPPLGETIADMASATVPVEPMPVPKVTLDQLEDSYRAALEVAQDPQVRREIATRLADMEMARSEHQQTSEIARRALFTDAIALYEDLLQAHEAQPAEVKDAKEGARLLYQLSKAYALDGRTEESAKMLDRLVTRYPDSPFSAEAEFRRAEMAFSAGDYARAELLYDRVLGVGQTPFYSNALYMHGWSLFKQGQYRESLTSFAQALDDVMVPGASIEQLANSRQNLVADTLRIMAIALSYLDGVETIENLAADGQPLQNQHLLYEQLGNLYLEKKRYRDSAETFSRYAELYPDSDYAPELSVRAIQAYEEGRFPSLVRPAKEDFVRRYGLDSPFMNMRSMLRQEPLLPYLHQYLDELASYYHAKAQRASAAGSLESPDVQQDYLRAANYYRQFISLFPMDESLPGMTFLMAEAYFQGGALIEALIAYEQVAYDFQDPENGAEAAYSTILTLERLIQATPEENQQAVLYKWQDQKVQRAIQFAELYADDERAPAVLAHAAQELFEQGDLKQAIELAARVTQWQPLPNDAIQKTAWLVRAHSLFDLELFTSAEDAYREALKRLNAPSEDREQVVERIAASMYEQAELQIAAGDAQGAVDLLLNIRETAPVSDIAVAAQFDAANHLIELQEWKQAEQVLVDFRQRYPDDPLSQSIAPKLANLYQEIQDWAAAAQELSIMAAQDSDADVRRQSLYLAAELFEKAGKTGQAIIHYRSYAHTYAEPFGLATEARYRLTELYRDINEPLKRNYWLKKIIDAHEVALAGSGSTDRARYLAAFAARELANVEYYAFRQIKLEQPIESNLKRKKAAMEKALKSYRRVLDIGVAEFTTEASNRIGMVYAQLSKDLMESERPQGLNALELEQYELLLEEQAFPFEEKAIEIHAVNAKRSWAGTYDEWVKRSFETLAQLLPARYGKTEVRQEVSDGIY